MDRSAGALTLLFFMDTIWITFPVSEEMFRPFAKDLSASKSKNRAGICFVVDPCELQETQSVESINME